MYSVALNIYMLKNAGVIYTQEDCFQFFVAQHMLVHYEAGMVRGRFVHGLLLPFFGLGWIWHVPVSSKTRSGNGKAERREESFFGGFCRRGVGGREDRLAVLRLAIAIKQQSTHGHQRYRLGSGQWYAKTPDGSASADPRTQRLIVEG